MTNDPTISDDMLEAVIFRTRLNPLVGKPCSTCRHYGVEHLVYLGPLKFCMDNGCSCGSRSLMALLRTLMPFLPVILAIGYLAYHLIRWAATGFLVIGG